VVLHFHALIVELRRDDLLIVMRVYFEKPRTTVGWKARRILRAATMHGVDALALLRAI
jgi:phospho-2-dehydro-3-deoxyheptonate aldolase